MSYDRGNIWNQQYHSDDSDVVRRGTQPFSLTGIQGVKLGNGDVFYLCSPSAGGSITVSLPSATKNTGAVHFIKLRSAGDVIVSAAGGTIQTSATMSTSGAFMALRSNGVDWWPEGAAGVPDPLNVGVLNAGSVSISAGLVVGGAAGVSGTLSAGVVVAGSLTVSGSAVIGGGLNVLGAAGLNVLSQTTLFGVANMGSVSVSAGVFVSGNATISGTLAATTALNVAGSASFSGSVAFAVQPNFPGGATTSITGGAMIAYAGNRLYEISLGAADIALVLPDPAAASGMRATVKVKATTGGQVLLTGHIEGSATASATVTVSGALSALNLIAGQSTWWRA